jgi:hypothetical protein
MTRIIALALAATLSVSYAQADGRGHEDGHHGYYGDDHEGRGWCPPGLAKKHNGCMPPGHARYPQRGEHYYDYRYTRIDPRNYNLDVRYGWYRLGDNVVVKTDRKTGAIIELFDAINTLSQ